MSDGVSEDLAQRARREIEQAAAERSRYRSELARLALDSGGGRSEGPMAAATGEPAMTILTDRSLPDGPRVEVMNRLGASLIRRPEYLDTLLDIVTDQEDGATVRTAALRLLGSASFQVARFGRHQAAYKDALRLLITDPEPALADTAVSVLAQGHDDVVQQVLLDGLRGAGPLPVGRERAIELLAEDDHLDNLPWLQELYHSHEEGHRQTAVRHMGSYPAARTDLEAVLRDKNESAAVREQSAAALRYLAPDRFDAVAKEIALDTDDDPDVRTACLQTLRNLGDAKNVYGDSEFVNRVADISREDAAPQVAKIARDLVEHRPDS